MRTVAEMYEELQYVDNKKGVEAILKKWAEEIIDQCAKVTMVALPGDGNEVIQELKDQL